MRIAFCCLPAVMMALVGCAPESAATTSTAASSSSSGGQSSSGLPDAGLPACAADPVLAEAVMEVGADPVGGTFPLEHALAGLPAGDGPLRAIITTELGTLVCQLRADKAPNAVANFAGLARGTRPFEDPATMRWSKRRFYDGLLFHRVIPEFMAQGGDPLGTGFGGPGYAFDDEITDLTHVAGALAYANTGPHSNGSQFFITEVASPHLDGDYTVFGECLPLSVVVDLTGVPVDANDKPVTALPMTSVVITRCPL